MGEEEGGERSAGDAFVHLRVGTIAIISARDLRTRLPKSKLAMEGEVEFVRASSMFEASLMFLSLAFSVCNAHDVSG